MNITVTDTALLTPTGGIASNTPIKIVCLEGYDQVLTGAISEFTTDDAGAYSFPLYYGVHAIYVRFDTKFKLLGKVTITSELADTATISDLLLYTEPMLPDEIALVSGLVEEARGYAEDAETAATQAGERLASYEVETTEYLINTFDSDTLDVGDVVKTLGYSSKGDGGGVFLSKTGLSGTPSQTFKDTLSGSVFDSVGSEFLVVSKESDLNPNVFGGVVSETVDSSDFIQAYANHSKLINIDDSYAINKKVDLTFSHVVNGIGKVFVQAPDATEEEIVGFYISDNPDGSDRYATGEISGVEIIRSVNTGGIGVFADGDFSKKQKYVMDQINIRGNSASSASPYYFHIGAVFNEMKAIDVLGGKVNGNIDTTTNPDGQVKTIAYESRGNAGNHVYDRVLVSSVHTAIAGLEGVEGIRVTSSNLTNVVIGLNLGTSTQEPGGWIEETHINAVESGIIASNRSGMHVIGCEIFRSNDYFESPEWKGIDLNNVSQSNFTGLTFKPQTINGDGSRTNITIQDSDTLNFNQVYSRGENGIKSNGGNSTICFNGFTFEVNTGNSIDLDDTDEDIHLGKHFFPTGNRGYGNIPAKSSITVDTYEGNLGYIPELVVIQDGGTTDVFTRSEPSIILYDFSSTTGSSFTRNLDISVTDGLLRGDKVTFVCSLEADYPTVRFRSGDGGSLINFLSPSTGKKSYTVDFVYSGTSWILLRSTDNGSIV